MTVIIHERLGHWTRQIRPRLRAWPIRWLETRSAVDIVEAVRSASWPIVLVDLDDRPDRMLEELQSALFAGPACLALVLNPRSIAGAGLMAREVGATMVMDGPVVPPKVEAVLLRWLPMARERAESEGWAQPQPAEPNPWDVPFLLAR